MLNSPVLETILSLTVIIFVFAVLVTCVQEGYVSIVKSRGKMLERAIDEVLNDPFNKNFAYLLYQHPQIDLLKRKQGSVPSYIEGETFAQALMDLIGKESTEIIYKESDDKKTMIKEERFIQSLLEKINLVAPKNTDPAAINILDKYKMGVESLAYSDLKKLLLSFLENGIRKAGANADEQIADLKTQIVTWYNGYMDRVTGWYKRKIRKNIIAASAIVTLFFNLNFITISKTLYADTKLRGTLTAMADTLSKQQNPISTLQEKIKNDGAALQDINVNAIIGVELPIGWKTSISDAGIENKSFFGKIFGFIGYFFINHFNGKNILGWSLFIMCLSLGAPFWFDMMKKIVNVRSAGLSPKQKNQP